jgi:hypothetical protein
LECGGAPPLFMMCQPRRYWCVTPSEVEESLISI